MSDSSLEIIDWSDAEKIESDVFVNVVDLPMATSLSESLSQYYGTNDSTPDKPLFDHESTDTLIPEQTDEIPDLSFTPDLASTDSKIKTSTETNKILPFQEEYKTSPSEMFLSCSKAAEDNSGYNDDLITLLDHKDADSCPVDHGIETKDINSNNFSGMNPMVEYSSDSASEGLNDISEIRRKFLRASSKRSAKVKHVLGYWSEENQEYKPAKVRPRISSRSFSRSQENTAASNETSNNDRIRQDLRLARSSELRIRSPLRTTRLNYGFFHWLKSAYYLQVLARRAKNTLNAILTTLDPQMSGVIEIESDMSLFVLAVDSNVSAAIQKAFRTVFAHCPHMDIQSIPVFLHSLPVEPIGFDSGLLCAESKIHFAREKQLVPHNSLVVSVSPVLVEITPKRWHNCTCILLDDPQLKLTLNVFTQTTPVPNEYVTQVKLRNPDGYVLRNHGLMMSIGEIMNILSGIPKHDWQKTTTEVSCYSSIENATKSLAGMYKKYVEGWTGASQRN